MSTSTESPTLTAKALTLKLLAFDSDPEQFLADFAEDTAQITTTLHSQQFQDNIKLRNDLALAQARLQAAAALPECVHKLIALTSAEKPEVARRSIMAVMAIAGLPTRAVAPPPPPPPPDPDDQDDDEDDDQDDHDFRTPEQRFLIENGKRQDQAILKFHRTLNSYRGIDLRQITKENFHGFADYLQAYFTPAGITFYRDDRPQTNFDNSIHNPDAVARAHAYFNATQSTPAATPAPAPETNQNPNESAPFALPPTPAVLTHDPPPSS